MEAYGKALATIEDVGDDDLIYGPNGGFTAVLSTPSMDRDGDNLLREEWLELPEHCTLDMDHGMTVATTIGSFTPYWGDDGSLMMRAAFSSIPRAQEARTLVKERHVRDVSVAFMTDKTKKSGEARRELLNAGIVGVGSNRDAKILDSKSVTLESEALDRRAQEIPAERAEAAVMKATLAGEITHKEAAWLLAEITFKAPKPYEDAETVAVEDADVKAPMGVGDNPALTQAIHDAAVHLGAACYPLQPEDEDPTGSSDGANRSAEDVAETAEVEAETKDCPEDEAIAEIPDDSPLGQWLGQFEKRLAEKLIGSKESPAEPPADDAAAASDEEPAPAETKAADDAAEDTTTQLELMRMYMALHDN